MPLLGGLCSGLKPSGTQWPGLHLLWAARKYLRAGEGRGAGGAVGVCRAGPVRGAKTQAWAEGAGWTGSAAPF